MSAWGRVVDYREGQINKLKNVNIYLESEITKKDILEFDFEHICFATGSKWRNDGVGRINLHPLEIDNSMNIYTPDDIMSDKKIYGKVPHNSTDIPELYYKHSDLCVYLLQN